MGKKRKKEKWGAYSQTLSMPDIQKFDEKVTKESSKLQHHLHIQLKAVAKAAQTFFPQHMNL